MYIYIFIFIFTRLLEVKFIRWCLQTCVIHVRLCFHSVHPRQSAHCVGDEIPWSDVQSTTANGVVKFWRKTRQNEAFNYRTRTGLIVFTAKPNNRGSCVRLPFIFKDFWAQTARFHTSCLSLCPFLSLSLSLTLQAGAPSDLVESKNSTSLRTDIFFKFCFTAGLKWNWSRDVFKLAWYL
jgi:hypothetical protein